MTEEQLERLIIELQKKLDSFDTDLPDYELGQWAGYTDVLNTIWLMTGKGAESFVAKN